MQHNSLVVFRQQLESSVVRVFLLRPRAGLGSLIADADIAGCPAASQTRQVVHLLADHFRAFSRFFTALALYRHRNLDLSGSGRERRLA